MLLSQQVRVLIYKHMHLTGVQHMLLRNGEQKTTLEQEYEEKNVHFPDSRHVTAMINITKH